MTTFYTTASQMIILFTLVGIGFAMRRKGVMNDEFDGKLSFLVINVAMPAMIISSVLGSSDLPSTHTICEILMWGTACYIFVIFVAIIVANVLRTDAKTRGTLEYLMVFGNVGFIGFPVLNCIFGPEAVLYGAVFNIPATFFTWSAGVLMLSMREKGEKKASAKETLIGLGKAMMSPCMISCFAALALIMGHVTDSGVIGQTFEFAGQLCVPGAMLIVGSSIGKMPLKEMFTNARPYVATLFRLLVIPFAVYFVFSFFITDHLLLGVITICAAMPAASSGTMMCIDFGGNLKTMTQGTFLSTVFSLGTIPTVAAVLI
ncbi:MAG: AEC family transporter [Eggerthellaceae bacterium]